MPAHAERGLMCSEPRRSGGKTVCSFLNCFENNSIFPKYVLTIREYSAILLVEVQIKPVIARKEKPKLCTMVKGGA